MFNTLFNVFSQDLIITKNQDSISGEILSITNSKVYYRIVENLSIKYCDINLTDITNTIQDFYSQPITDEIKLSRMHQGYIVTKDGKKIFCNYIWFTDDYIIYSEISMVKKL